MSELKFKREVHITTAHKGNSRNELGNIIIITKITRQHASSLPNICIHKKRMKHQIVWSE